MYDNYYLGTKSTFRNIYQIKLKNIFMSFRFAEVNLRNIHKICA